MGLAFRTRKPLPSLFAAAPLGAPALDGTSGGEVYTEYVFPVAGQGTISFTIAADGPFRIVLNDEKVPAGPDHPVIVLDMGVTATTFRNRNDDSPASVIAMTSDPRALLMPGVAIPYWFSLDTNNRRLRFGKGEMLPQLTLLEANLPPKPDPTTNCADPYAYIANLRYVALAGTPLPQPSAHFLWPVPVTVGLPGLVVPSDAITLEDIATNRCTVSASLDQAAQVLYGTVAGRGIQLDTPDFPDFSAAIDYSIMTPGCWCYKTLEAKADEFGKPNPDETYLRITIGPNQGDSPGSPYVLEIWPGGHYSPIHDHGDAAAIIKVLHGTIWVELYPELSPAVLDYYAEAVFEQGEVTFLSPQFYQIHKLINKNPAGYMTATIQCYRYPATDTAHYEYFDYIAEDDTIQHFTPNSDCEFLAFKEIVRQEWQAARLGAQAAASAAGPEEAAVSV
ncbi:MAG: hypothetical protein QOI11_2879 [Candidatus Eremiobacteraeota bacterium]|jgi:hypothetical protein|nr:hypothetical protein [Candidatus Eremiobacteraeota bacterium]